MLTSPALPSAFAGQAVLCQDQPATIVGDPTITYLEGTDSDDVVVTAGSSIVWGLAGNDLICITGDTGEVHAGGGDDRVASDDDTQAGTRVTLGSGDDTFAGGARRDGVMQGPGDDLVTTGDGNDSYGSYYGRYDRPPAGSVGDEVSLGAGDDWVTSAFTRLAAPIDGGTGVNHLEVWDGFSNHGKTMQVDNVAETVTIEEAVWFSWDNFTTFEFSTEARVSFVGSDAAENLTAYEVEGTGPAIGGRWELGAGDDRLFVQNVAGHVDGGPGTDRIHVQRRVFSDVPTDALGHRVVLDLAKGVLHFGQVSKEYRVRGIEDAAVSGFRAGTLRGNGHANNLRVEPACFARVFGGAGDDRLHSSRARDCLVREGADPGSRHAVKLRGQTGDDVLIGAVTADLLVGGGGSDSVYGRLGRDTCDAEVQTSCEREWTS
ncbi:hypothetical protein [Nocardioides taihuensis]|uniref:Calcium-binding protein n=1 Tax=Nocardioides taihuensis TaxID=1835606 RepID=A0ABW0BKI8_9ACTN